MYRRLILYLDHFMFKYKKGRIELMIPESFKICMQYGSSYKEPLSRTKDDNRIPTFGILELSIGSSDIFIVTSTA